MHHLSRLLGIKSLVQLKNRLFFLVCFSLLNYSVQSQEANITSSYAYAEKIYMQLSSTIYTTDNTIWFKSIVTDLTLVPSELSNVLHVEFIDFDKRIIDQKLLKLENGIASGFIDLDESMPSGRYQVRAYTEWNRNFGKDFISETYVDIYAPKEIIEKEEALQGISLSEISPNQFEISGTAYPKFLNPKYKGKLKLFIHTENSKDSVVVKKGEGNSYHFQYQLPKETVKARIEIKLDDIKLKSFETEHVSSYSKTIAVNKDFIDLQFFPEGGKLVDGLVSRVAFKALGYNNKGKEIQGTIVDENNNLIMPFKSNQLGMGITYLTSDIRKKYYATVNVSKEVSYKYKLPEVAQQGTVLNVIEQNKYIIISLQQNSDTAEPVIITVSSRGVMQDQFEIGFNNGKATTALEKENFPEGLLKVRITNQKEQIICERLFFNYKEDDRIQISAKTNLQRYNQRGKTIVNLNTSAKDSSAMLSNLSVLVVNKKQLESANDTKSNLLSYFLLNSELRGAIENPSSYFDVTNKRRKYDMEALVLSQGWSNYKYVDTEPMSDFKYLPEKKILVSGRVKNLLNARSYLKKPIDLTMIYGPLNVMTQQVDSSGRFDFYIEDYYKDEFKVVIQSKSTRGKKKDFTIELDSYQAPNVNFDEEENIALADSLNSYVKQSIANNSAVKEFEASQGQGIEALNEVLVNGYKLSPAREKMMNSQGLPNVVVEGAELLSKVQGWQNGLFSLLQYSFPDVIEIHNVVNPPAVGFNDFLQAKVYGTNFTFIVIDGIPVKLLDYPFLGDLPINEIKSIEVLNTPKNSNLYVNKVFPGPFEIVEDRNIIGVIEQGKPINTGEGLRGVAVHYDVYLDRYMLDIELQKPIISIYTYAGKGFNGVQRSKGIFKGLVQGFTPKREFYAPKYGKEDFNDWSMPDVRSVVHWTPSIDTDVDGNAQVEFYNGDNMGEMLIIVEGITENGRIGYFEVSYEVDEKLE